MLSALFDRRAISSVPWQTNSFWGAWPGDGYGPTWAGVTVDEQQAVRLLTVYGCVRLISDSISTLPIDCFRAAGDVREPLPTPRWLAMPSPDLDFTDWCGQILWSLLINGNAYIAVLRGETGSIVELFVFDPCAVTVRRTGANNTGRKQYVVNGQVFPGEMVHLKAIMQPGSDVGFSPVEAARQSIGLGLASQEYAAGFFAGEGNMPGVIEIPDRAQQATMSAMAELWRRKRSKKNKGLPGVLSGGAQWKPTGVTNEQAQFLQTRKFTAAEIAGQMFMVDPSELGIPVEGTSLTYQNLEQRSIRLSQRTLLPWIVRLEKAISALMAAPRFMKFNLDGFQRADLKTRFESYAIGIENGFFLADEAREKEDLPPLPEPVEVPNDDDAAA